MKKLLILCAAAAGVLLASCTPRCRVVENPLIETTNTRTLDIVKVELSDTATVLHVDAYFRPRNWIRIAKETYLQTAGEKYVLTGSEGITPDSLFWMPDSGEASFVLRFPPLPRGTKSFDFIESDCDDCFKLYGIDLTGKTEYAEYPEGLPKELRKAPKDGPVPDPILAVGETTVNVHLLGFREGMFREVKGYVSPMLTRYQTLEAPIDPKTGVATFCFEQYGTASISFGCAGSGLGQIWVAPGETMDLYVDLRASGREIVQRRSKTGETARARSIYATGTYADLNMLYDMNSTGKIIMDCFSPEFADYRMTADEYTQMVVSQYKTLADSIARSDMPEMMKAYQRTTLNQMTVLAMSTCNYFLENNYRFVHKSREPKIDYEFAVPEPKHYAAVCELFDINDPKELIGDELYNYRMMISRGNVNWSEAAGGKEGLVADLRKTADMVTKAENVELTEEDLAQLRSLKEPFYAEACEAIQARVRRELAAVEGKAVIQPTPDVSLDKLFEAIIAPHKGKVVFVDFWNTWCGPCQASIKATEPLKTAELKSDDLVWIYIANETSPLVTYKTQIAKIQGKHYRLNDEQWRYLCDKFKIDGIPSYVVVGKDGSYKLRNDLRDHDKLKRDLKKMIE